MLMRKPSSRWMSPVWLVALVGVMVLLPDASSRGEDVAVALAEAARGAQAVLSTVRSVDGLTFSVSSMGRRLAGVLASFAGDELVVLQRCQLDAREEAPASRTAASVYLHLKLDDVVNTFEIRSLDGQRVMVRDIDEDGPGQVFDRQRLKALYGDANRYRGPFTTDGNFEVRQEDFDLAMPYVPSPFTLDEPMVRARQLPTLQERIDSFPEHSVQRKRLDEHFETYGKATTRILGQERFSARLPKGYDARTPAGLLVWCRGWRGIATPPMFPDALDELGFICVSAANTHNGRHATDRKQLMLDLVATARSRFHVDDRRVYVSGISGGGKVSSSLVIGFPEVFTGAIPIVGLASYNDLHGLLPLVEKPTGEQLALARRRPMVNMTGVLDFNYYEILDRVHRLNLDRFDRVSWLEWDDMGHQMPTAERFAEALRLVDGVYQKMREGEQKEATDALEAYLGEHGENPPPSPEAREQLAEVMRIGPWTEAAWTAAELLR